MALFGYQRAGRGTLKAPSEAASKASKASWEEKSRKPGKKDQRGPKRAREDQKGPKRTKKGPRRAREAPKVAADAARNAIMSTPGRSYVYLKLNTGAQLPSKVVIELFEDICPKTCANFKALCEGFKPKNGSETLSYSGTEFHRVVKGMYIQGGNLAKTYGKYLIF